jgi:hypothetical protein
VSFDSPIPGLVIDVLLVACLGRDLGLMFLPVMDSSVSLLLHCDGLVLPSFV